VQVLQVQMQAFPQDPQVLQGKDTEEAQVPAVARLEEQVAVVAPAA
jgi:hypothetical protein